MLILAEKSVPMTTLHFERLRSRIRNGFALEIQPLEKNWVGTR